MALGGHMVHVAGARELTAPENPAECSRSPVGGPHPRRFARCNHTFYAEMDDPLSWYTVVTNG